MSKKAADFRKANNAVINNAFKRMKMTKDEAIRSAMYGILEDAVQYALEIHDEIHQEHVAIGDTYGWMLVHNHKIQEVAVVSTSNNRGEATDLLRNYLKELPAKGWAGVVMAGMAKPSFFSIRYEEKILDETVQITRQNFFEYFTKI